MHSMYRQYLNLILNDEIAQAQGEGQVQDVGYATEELGYVVPLCSVSPATGAVEKNNQRWQQKGQSSNQK